MDKKIGLRMGQTPGAVAEDGGQSMLARHEQYTPSSQKSQPENMEGVMKNDEFLISGGCGHSAEDLMFSANVLAFCLIAGAVLVAFALLFG